jgi:hypothetical protein
MRLLPWRCVDGAPFAPLWFCNEPVDETLDTQCGVEPPPVEYRSPVGGPRKREPTDLSPEQPTPRAAQAQWPQRAGSCRCLCLDETRRGSRSRPAAGSSGCRRLVSRVLSREPVTGFPWAIIPLGPPLPTGSSGLPERLGRATLKRVPSRPCSKWGLPGRPGLPSRRCALTAPFHPHRWANPSRPRYHRNGRWTPDPERPRQSSLCGTFHRLSPPGR